ncbi:MAG: NAD(P)-binding protein, partial [Betaproteobacteria bacterium]|nr:NAD(P)-binding protein [Betaproteobacteria bacterium]
MKHPNIAIIGAGWAGLTPAVTLSDKGLATTTFEASRTLGGRARKITFNDKILDN